MNTQKAFIKGFIKRAAIHGVSEIDARNILKLSTAADAPAAQTEKNWLEKLQELGNRTSGSLNSAGKGIDQLLGGVKSMNSGWNDLKDSFNVAAGKREPTPVAAAPQPATLREALKLPELPPALSPSNITAAGMSPQAQGFRLGLGGDSKISLNDPIPGKGGGFNLGLSGGNKVSLTQDSAPVVKNESSALAAVPQVAKSMAQSAATGAGPSDAQLAKIMGSYDSKSALDRAKAQRIRELYSQGITSPNAIYADKGYSGINPRTLRAGGDGAAQRPQPLQQAQPAKSSGIASLYGGPAGVDPRAFNSPQRLNYR